MEEAKDPTPLKERTRQERHSTAENHSQEHRGRSAAHAGKAASTAQAIKHKELGERLGQTLRPELCSRLVNDD